MNRIVRLTAAAIAALGLVAAAPAGRATFDVGGVKLSLPLPASYCEPSGPMTALAQTVAAADPDNVTDLTLYKCDATPDDLGDYVLIKTPVRVLGMTVDRPTLLAQIGPEFDKGPPVDNKKLGDDVASSLDRVSGTKAKVATQMSVRGHDDVCGYVGGSAQLSNSSRSVNVAVGGCITAAGGRIVQVFRYTMYRDPSDIDRMMKDARAIALTIGPQA